MNTETKHTPGMKIGTIEQELQQCRAAFESHPDATWAWCCHHTILCEPLTEPFSAKIAYILSAKPTSEQAVRLSNLRPCKDAAAVALAYDVHTAAVKAADAAYVYAVKPPAGDTYVAAYAARDAAAAARKTARQTLRELHDAEWPNNTWDGISIFSE